MKMAVWQIVLLLISCYVTVSATAIDFDIVPANDTFDEMPQVVYIIVTRTTVDYNLSLTVTSTGADFAEVSDYIHGNIYFSPEKLDFFYGDTTQYLTLSFMTDLLLTKDRVFTITFTADGHGISKTGTYTIKAVRPYDVAIYSWDTIEFYEGNGTVPILFICTGPDHTYVPPGVYTTENITAIAGEDYIYTSQDYSCVLDWEYIVDFKFTANIDLIDDNIPEPTETFEIVVRFGQSYPTRRFVITIKDDDPTMITSALPETINEGDSINFAGTTFTFEHNLPAPITINVTILNGTAILNSDFVLSLTSNPFTFTYDPSDPTSRQAFDDLTISVPEDNTPEGDKTFTVTFTSEYLLTGDTTKTITIKDKAVTPDKVTLPPFLALYENGGSKDISITRTDSHDEVTVQVNTNDVSAKAGSDYTALIDYDVTFAAGSLTAIFTVDISDDQNAEGDETFTLVVTGNAVLTTDPYTFIIVDDEGSRPFDCRRKNQNCFNSTDICSPSLPLCECGTPERKGDMCNIIIPNIATGCSTDCNNNGVCQTDSEGLGLSCTCYPGYYGDDCEHPFLLTECSSDTMTFIANPHGNFVGKIFVMDKINVSNCIAIAVPDPPQPNDNIDDGLNGFYLTVRHDSVGCGIIKQQEGPSEISYTRKFIIQYNPAITTALDQSVTVSCKFDRNNLLVSAGIVNIAPSGQFTEESSSNIYSPLTMGVDNNDTPITDTSSVTLDMKLCVTLRVPEAFGGLEIIDIEFNNSLPEDPSRLRVYTAGCSEPDVEYVLVNKPFYPANGNKREIKFCFFVFKFVNSFRLTAQIKVKVCSDPADCELGTCDQRFKRQAGSSNETVVGTTFNVRFPSGQTAGTQQDQTDASKTRIEEVCNLPLEFMPTVVCLGALIVVLVLLCLYLTYRLIRKSSTKIVGKQIGDCIR